MAMPVKMALTRQRQAALCELQASLDLHSKSPSQKQREFVRHSEVEAVSQNESREDHKLLPPGAGEVAQ